MYDSYIDFCADVDCEQLKEYRDWEDYCGSPAYIYDYECYRGLDPDCEKCPYHEEWEKINTPFPCDDCPHADECTQEDEDNCEKFKVYRENTGD